MAVKKASCPATNGRVVAEAAIHRQGVMKQTYGLGKDASDDCVIWGGREARIAADNGGRAGSSPISAGKMTLGYACFSGLGELPELGFELGA
jgi:hypothetical protein